MDKPPKFLARHPVLKDALSLVTFIAAVILGTIILNAFIFRSYNVIGGSMENTLHSDDRIIVNRVPVTISHLFGREYVPSRGEIIVFANGDNGDTLTCEPIPGIRDQYVIKRVIAFPGEGVTVKDGILTVWTDPSDKSTAFHPDDYTRKSDDDGPKQYTSDEVGVWEGDTLILPFIVPSGELFVAGDNREGQHSLDSRNGLGTVPFCRIIGPAALRLFPFNKIRFF